MWILTLITCPSFFIWEILVSLSPPTLFWFTWDGIFACLYKDVKKRGDFSLITTYFLEKILFVNKLIVACAGLRCCAGFLGLRWAPAPLCGWTSPVWGPGSRAQGLGSCSSRAQLLPWQVASSQIRDQTPVSYRGRRIPYRWATRETPCDLHFKNV